MIRSLFLVFHGLAPHNGISKKITYQFNALKELGLDIDLCYQSYENSSHKRFINGRLIKDYKKGLWAKIYKRIEYSSIVRYVKEEGVKYIYARYDHNSNPFTIRLFRSLKKSGAWIDLEIPTYPYDKEYLKLSLKFKLDLAIDKLFRRRLAKYVNRIITFSDASEIFGVKTLKISNGIDFGSIKIKEEKLLNKDIINLIGVADIHFWHGYDRMAAGLADYYSGEVVTKVYFHIVGGGCREDIEKIKQIAASGNIEQYIFFYGPKAGVELDDLFDNSDFGVASLARHRSGIDKIKTLKNREYAARGIPFIYSETDEDFERMPYIVKAPADESPVDVKGIVDFCRQHHFTPEEIRSSIEKTLSWKAQMKKVMENFKDLMYEVG
jgi:glycosyltransferase involved in cell wall biosynthesis